MTVNVGEEMVSSNVVLEVLDCGSTRKRRKRDTPVDLSVVRRSARSNRYQGFKAPSMAVVTKKPSQVRPRKIPAISPTSKELILLDVEATAEQPTTTTTTPISTLQEWGASCGIPAAEVSMEILSSEPDAELA